MTKKEKELLKLLKSILEIKPMLFSKLSGLDMYDEHTKELFTEAEPDIVITMGEFSLISQRFINAEDFVNELESQS